MTSMASPRKRPGAPELAKTVKELLLASGFEHVDEDRKRGLDRGAWALAPLKEEGVLIIGSGSATHSLRALKQYAGDGSVVPWALAFETWLKDALLEGRYEDVNRYEEKAPYAKMAHPWPGHFFPLHVALGAASEDAKRRLIHHSWSRGTLSYASYQFTAAS
ncbi:hypothetical protein SLEP1_g34849 [Rubroshorea leprosula]|uniref:Extradiol ring-cleavage dioxygenase class III enzyme subunit B domain-containing protein n=1 Tax=Rubroshorea leprosula TaxID=152421 RepID=A0AAV5KLB5_9ROSI|nr:hypothetical protein SLEP1_g34849 [Rubroshorea leprosula]